MNVTEDDARINKLVLGLAGSPASFAGYEVAMRWNTQKVPFTGRKHSILIPRWIEESSGVVLLKVGTLKRSIGASIFSIYPLARGYFGPFLL